MPRTPGSGTVAVADWDVYGGIPVTPTHAPPSAFPKGMLIFGGMIEQTEFSIQLPAFAEDILMLQLDYNAAVVATLDRTHAFETSPGDLIIIPRGQPAHFANRTTKRSLNLVIALPPPLLQAAAEQDLATQPQQVELCPFMAEQRDPLLHGIGTVLHQQLQINGTSDRLYFESLIMALTVHVLRNYATVKPPQARHDKMLRQTALRRVCDYIEANLERELTLEELGKIAQYSPFHLARLFRQATGQSLHQHIAKCRLAKAKLLLETTDMPLRQIAQQVGFTDQSHLSNHFRKAFGYAPSTERRSLN